MTDAHADPRRIEYRPLSSLVPAARNPKAHDADMLDGSVEEFGYVELITEDGRTGRVIAGHGRLEALRRREAAKPDAPPDGVLRADDDAGTWLVPILVGWSSADDDEAEAYLLISNRAPQSGGWLTQPLAEVLADLDQRRSDLRQLGWDDQEYADLVLESDALADQAGGFLDDLAGDPDPEPRPRPRAGGADVVDLRLPMADRQRDEAIALLRQHQRALADAGRPAVTLADVALEVLRTWTLG